MTSDLTKSITSKFDLFLRGLTSCIWPLYRFPTVHRSRKHTNLPKLPGLASEWPLTSKGSITSKFDLILRGLTSRSWPLYLSTIVEAENTQTCPNCLGRPGLASEWLLTSFDLFLRGLSWFVLVCCGLC